MDIPCVGAVIRGAEGRLVLIRRGRPPGQGLWSIPGGRVEPGEDGPDAVRREVLEETGLIIDVTGVAGSVVLPALEVENRYLVTDYLAVVQPGTRTDLTAGDDASDARWVTRDELATLDVSPGLARTLDEWGVWSAASR